MPPASSLTVAPALDRITDLTSGSGSDFGSMGQMSGSGNLEWGMPTRSVPPRWRDPDFLTPFLFGSAFVGAVLLILFGAQLNDYLGSGRDPAYRYGLCPERNPDCVDESQVVIEDASNDSQITVRTVTDSQNEQVSRIGGAKPSAFGGLDDILLETWHGGQPIALVDRSNGAIMQLRGYPPQNPIYWIWPLAGGVPIASIAIALFLWRRHLFIAEETSRSRQPDNV